MWRLGGSLTIPYTSRSAILCHDLSDVADLFWGVTTCTMVWYSVNVVASIRG